MTLVLDSGQEISEEVVSRYAEWQFILENKVLGELTANELETSPSIGLHKPDGIYRFTFEGGRIYVEVENNSVISLSGYATEELGTFSMITAEYGNTIRQSFEAQFLNQTNYVEDKTKEANGNGEEIQWTPDPKGDGSEQSTTLS